MVNIQGDEPFASADVVRSAADLVTSGRFPLGTVACRDDADALARPDVVKVVADDAGRALYFSRAGIPCLRDARHDEERALRDALVRRHIGVYAYTRDALARWVALYLRLRRIYLRIKHDPQRFAYTDTAMSAIADGDVETPELLGTEAARAYVNDQRRLQRIREQAPAPA